MQVSTRLIRHEYKYYINDGQYIYLSGLMESLLRRDPNGDANNQYHIRSLYFDTPENSAVKEKVAGEGNRNKYRIRIYNHRDDNIRLECKSKFDNLISKQSLKIPRSLTEQLMAGDPTGLEFMRHPLLQEVYYQMKVRLLRPVVIVDYVREAYIHEAEEVRITFDRSLKTGLNNVELFNPDIPTLSPFDIKTEILEIKYNRFLPSYLQNVFSAVGAQRSAISKYVWCRRFEGLEY